MPVAGAVIGAIGSVAGGAMGARGQAQATAAEIEGQRAAMEMQLAMFNQSRADQLPMIQARNAALPLFMQLLGLSPSALNFGAPSTGGVQMNTVGASENDRNWRTHFQDQLGIPGVGSIDSNPIRAFQDTLRTPFRNFGDWDGSRMADDPGRVTFTYDEAGNVVGQQPTAGQAAAPIDINALIAATPGYQFRFNEGQRAAERSAAARGSLASGGTLRALARYGEGLAANEYGAFANRLASLIGLGQTAATTAGGWGNQVGGNIGQNLSNIGQARGSGYANTANIWGNAIGSAANQFGQYWNRPQTTTVPDSFTTNYSPTPYQGTFGTYGGGGP